MNKLEEVVQQLIDSEDIIDLSKFNKEELKQIITIFRAETLAALQATETYREMTQNSQNTLQEFETQNRKKFEEINAALKTILTATSMETKTIELAIKDLKS